MSTTNENDSYNLLSKIIHWATALIIFGLLFIGFYMEDIEPDSVKYKVYAMHKSFGILVLILACIRIIWLIIKRKPQHLSSHKPWERILSRTTQILIYATLFAVPLSGWAMSSSGGYAVKLFGIKLPALLEKNKQMGEIFEEFHEIFAFAIFFLVGLHILGALKHHFVDKDDTLKRMTAKTVGLMGGIIIMLLAVAAYVPTGVYVAEELVFEEADEDEEHDNDDHEH